MKQRRAQQTHNSAHKKSAEYDLLLKLDLDIRPRQKVDRYGHKRNSADEMSPYVARLRVDPEDGLEAGLDRGQRRPMAFQQEVVVAQPVRERVVRHRFPARLPDVFGEELDLLGAVLRHVEQVDRHREQIVRLGLVAPVRVLSLRAQVHELDHFRLGLVVDAAVAGRAVAQAVRDHGPIGGRRGRGRARALAQLAGARRVVLVGRRSAVACGRFGFEAFSR